MALISSAVRLARREALGVSVATGLYGVSFGALSVAAGLSVVQTIVLSLIMFSGGSQFAFVGVVAAGGGGPAAVATGALVGVRNALYGARMAPLLGVRGPRRLLAAQLTIDESTAVATAQSEQRAVREGFWWTGVGIYVLWNSFVTLGAFAGNALGDPRTWGLDAAAAAAFLALVWARLADPVARWVGLGAAVVALALTPVLPAGLPVLAAAAVAVVVGWVRPGVARPAAPADDAPGDEDTDDGVRSAT